MSTHKGGRGHKVLEKMCYGCHKLRAKGGAQGFSASQWGVAEAKLRRCADCISNGVTAMEDEDSSRKRLIEAVKVSQTEWWKKPKPDANAATAEQPPPKPREPREPPEPPEPTEPPEPRESPPPVSSTAPLPLEPTAAQQETPSASSPLRRSSREGGDYGAAAVAARSPLVLKRAADKAAGEHQKEMQQLHAKLAQLELQIAAANEKKQTERAAAEATAAAAAEMAANVKAALDEKIEKRIVDAAESNQSFAISEPLMRASIRAASLHMRDVAVARRNGTWHPSGNLKVITFGNPPPDKDPSCSDYMVAGCVHKVVDWREFEPEILFYCSKCGHEMVVPDHLPEPDGVPPACTRSLLTSRSHPSAAYLPLARVRCLPPAHTPPLLTSRLHAFAAYLPLTPLRCLPPA
eukprot:Transcript_18362.p1 GENE.Transcript_18362~~Transcript_18362.p1  ORF type:complete len:426 (-),score=73.12 Transcript_18362:243-1463(-)